MKETSDALQKKLRELGDLGEESARGLREDLLKQSNDLLDEMRARQTELTSVFDRRVRELSQAKTDRAALAAMFSEIALRLKDEFEIPGMNG